ncbi:hypothetical protein RN001_016153 [Aquatica leii]|uniref:Chitin-binding type-2 domain-containing protein n=1 Tax=Aquatica leii TaxID=1421715 RepID=A0AAN7PMW9_9COLE|nr:hypothetical protein RN001_016153 [Aquatica leii]
MDPVSLYEYGHPLTMEGLQGPATYVEVPAKLLENTALVEEAYCASQNLLEIGPQMSERTNVSLPNTSQSAHKSTNTHSGNLYEHYISDNTNAIKSQLQITELRSLLSKWNVEAIVDELIGMENSSCPESKKQYPGDCRLFYKCVPLSTSAHAYVWVPSRCSAGLVFHPTIKECINSKETSYCQDNENNDTLELYYRDVQYLQDNNFDTVDDTLELDELDYVSPTSESNSYTISEIDNSNNNVLNEFDQDHVPLSIVNNIPINKIDSQMSILKNIINDYKTIAYNQPFHTTVKLTPIEYAAVQPNLFDNLIPTQNSVSYSSTNSLKLKPNSLPTKLNKVTTQLVMQTPIPKKQSTKLNLDDFHVLKEATEDTSISFNPNIYNNANPQDIATLLFQKYLSNNNFMINGEYVRKGSIIIPLTTTRKPLVSTTHSYNLINQVSKQDHVTSQENSISFFTYSNGTNGFYGKSCLNGIRLPNPKDCTRYFLCNSSTISLRSYTCPPYTAFNKLKRMCDADEYQTCINRYTENSKIKTTESYDKVQCDTYMCGGLQNFNNSEMIAVDFKCQKDLIFCVKKQRCLQIGLC